MAHPRQRDPQYHGEFAEFVAGWRRAEERLYASAMVDPDHYIRVVSATRAAADGLSSCTSLQELIAAHEAGTEAVVDTLRAVGIDLDALGEPGLIVAGAFLLRYRELIVEQQQRELVERIGAARRRGDTWVVLYESGLPDQLRLGPCERVEMRLADGAGVRVAIEAEPESDARRFELQPVTLDPASGQVVATAWHRPHAPVRGSRGARRRGRDVARGWRAWPRGRVARVRWTPQPWRVPAPGTTAARARAFARRSGTTLDTATNRVFRIGNVRAPMGRDLVASPERVDRPVFDAHSHIGSLPGYAFYDLKEPVKPTVYDFGDGAAYLDHLDAVGVERSLVLPNYGVPDQQAAFSLNDVMLDAVTGSDRLIGGLWVSFLPQNRESTLASLQHAGEQGVVALKTTFLLGGNPDPEQWDDDTEEIAEACFAAAEEHDLVFHFHTSPGGASDISHFIPLVERYGKRAKIYLVHFGGGVSGHIRLVPRFLDWVEQGYRVYTDTSWAVGFGARWLLTEIENRGVGHDRVLFASDEPWSDFWSEYYKIAGMPVSDELKERVLHRNASELYGG